MSGSSTIEISRVTVSCCLLNPAVQDSDRDYVRSKIVRKTRQTYVFPNDPKLLSILCLEADLAGNTRRA
ncbi:MAG TPA: hypothetical protein VG273_11955 [Bryobacteraceae bacterium]|jgi:hypothetical protein|nr:hypothetical protein [Bryobacteraceae bacterium]